MYGNAVPSSWVFNQLSGLARNKQKITKRDSEGEVKKHRLTPPIHKASEKNSRGYPFPLQTQTGYQDIDASDSAYERWPDFGRLLFTPGLVIDSRLPYRYRADACNQSSLEKMSVSNPQPATFLIAHSSGLVDVFGQFCFYRCL